MEITNKLGEADITDAAMYVLLEAHRKLNTHQIRSEIRNLLEPAGANSAPLLNRNDEVIDQIIRNIVSHRNDSHNNIINKGYVTYDDNGEWEITPSGIQYLRSRMKERFKTELS